MGSQGQKDYAFFKCHLSPKLDYNKQIKRQEHCENNSKRFFFLPINPEWGNTSSRWPFPIMATFKIWLPSALQKKKKIYFIHKIKYQIHWEHQLLLSWVWLAKRPCKTAGFHKSASHHSCNQPSSDLFNTHHAPGTGADDAAVGTYPILFLSCLAWSSHSSHSEALAFP